MIAHAVLVTDTRVECLPGCWGPEPHLAEYRAVDGNAIAANRRKASGPLYVTPNNDPVKPPYGSAARAEYDRRQTQEGGGDHGGTSTD